VYRYRFIVIGVMVALCLGGGVFGLSLGKHVTQSGFYDDGSQSAKASVLADQVLGRDRTGHIIAIFTAPNGKTVDDPQWSKKVIDELNKFQSDHPEQVLGWAGWLRAMNTTDPTVSKMHTEDMKRTFISMALKGNNDDEILNNYKTIEPDLRKLNGGNVELAGLQPVASELTGTIADDQRRMEVLALPLVAVVLFLVFGGVIAAGLPVMVGGLAIAGALGIMRLMAIFGPVHYFAQPVVTMIGLGIAIDYGLFMVSRFREEIADGYDTETAVRRTVMTSGRTVVFSAVIIVAASAGLLLFPQGFLRSLTYAVIASVLLSAVLSVTVLPACLAVLGRHVDALGVRDLLKVPILRNIPLTRAIINWFADRLQKTKTREEIEHGFWGKLVNVVMKRPVAFAAPIIIILILLIIPLGKLALGGISEKYLPPDNPVRMAQEDFDKTFPGFRTQQLTLVVQNASPQQVEEIASKASQISGFTNATWQTRSATDEGTKDPKVTVLQNGLVNYNDAAVKIADLRSIQPPKGATLWVGGTPALEQDSIHSIFAKMPQMLVILMTTTTILMFLAFGSVVLPIKAALMSALTMGSTLGILTWIFVDGHLSHLLNFTPTPLTAPVIGLIIALIYGLSTDYEVFLVSRMVEARERGMSTAEAIRIGTAQTGRIITAAAAILIVVGAAFVFSDLVMMKYLAFGLVAALLLDATVVRMFLVPSVMKLLGDDCWWAPRWMRRLQNRIGLGEIELPDERKRPAVRDSEEALVRAGGPTPPPRRPHDPTHPGVEGATRRVATRPGPSQRSRPPQDAPSVAGTTKLPTAQPPRAAEPPTTRLSTAARNAARNVVNNVQRTARPAPPAQREEREIESWLGELRGGQPGAAAGGAAQQPPPPPVRPSAEKTTAIPVHRGGQQRGAQQRGAQERGGPDRGRANNAGGKPKSPADDTTTAMRAPRPNEPETEKMKAAPEDKEQQRRGGGVSAQDLLRREGRF
jgi:RND superfamily putative drug exporter